MESFVFCSVRRKILKEFFIELSEPELNGRVENHSLFHHGTASIAAPLTCQFYWSLFITFHVLLLQSFLFIASLQHSNIYHSMEQFRFPYDIYDVVFNLMYRVVFGVL